MGTGIVTIGDGVLGGFPAFLLAKKPENSVPEWSNPRPRWLSHWSISQDIHLHLSLQVPMHLHGYSHKHQYGFL